MVLRRIIPVVVSITVLAASALSQGSGEEARLLVERALSAWASQQSLCFHASGRTEIAGRSVSFVATVWRSGPDRVRVQYTEGGEKSSLVLVVADGKNVWRWNQARMEYQQLPAPAGSANLLALLSGLVPANATGALRLALGDSDLVPAGRYSMAASPPGSAAGSRLVQCSAVSGVGQAEVGSRAGFLIAEDENGPWLHQVQMVQTRAVSRSLARVTWTGSFAVGRELGPEGFTFTPPPGSRCVGVYESP